MGKQATGAAPPSTRRILLASLVGTAVEFYDFYIYATAAALVFGPERSGLETDDVALARTIVTVPINPEFGSLNLAQAVILITYEWSKGQGLASPPSTDLEPPAPQFELEGLIGQLDTMLERTGYFFPPDRTTTAKQTLRSVLSKPGWNAQEVRTLRGVLSTLERPRGRGRG